MPPLLLAFESSLLPLLRRDARLAVIKFGPIVAAGTSDYLLPLLLEKEAGLWANLPVLDLPNDPP